VTTGARTAVQTLTASAAGLAAASAATSASASFVEVAGHAEEE